MNKTEGNTAQFVFTLSEDIPAAKPEQQSVRAVGATPEDDVADWERSLERLRLNKQQDSAASLPIDDIFAQATDTVPVREGRVQRGAPVPTELPSSAPAAPMTTDEVILDPRQRERVYHAYLQEWQHKTSLEQAQKQSALNDTAVLFQEDWLAAQSCLTRAAADAPEVCTVRLHRQNQADVVESKCAVDNADHVAAVSAELPESGHDAVLDHAAVAAAPVLHVHLHVVEPQGVQARLVSCVSEQDLLRQLAEKLRPHLADAMAGMMRVTIQKRMAHVIADIQKQLLADIPTVVDEVLDHNLGRALQQVKKTARR